MVYPHDYNDFSCPGIRYWGSIYFSTHRTDFVDIDNNGGARTRLAGSNRDVFVVFRSPVFVEFA